MHVTIECRRPGSAAWKLVGDFTATAEEVEELRAVLEGRDPFAVLGRVGNPLIRDTLEAIREEGLQARVEFHTDN